VTSGPCLPAPTSSSAAVSADVGVVLWCMETLYVIFHVSYCRNERLIRAERKVLLLLEIIRSLCIFQMRRLCTECIC
jgi:hypothetical protein